MRLYIDGKMVKEESDAAVLERALAALMQAAKGSLELRRSPAVWVRATRDRSGACLLEISRIGRLLGMRIEESDFGQVRAVFQEFVRGHEPSLPWEKLAPLKDPGGVEFVMGDSNRDDCPLCRLLG